MVQFFEVSVEIITAITNSGKEKKVKETYLVDAQSVTEAETKVVKDFLETSPNLDFKVVSAKESKIVRIIKK
jgi:hypothetical protein